MPREDLGPVLAVSMGAPRKASPKNPGEAFKTARMWIPYHGFLSITNAGIPLWERKVAGYVCVHREGKSASAVLPSSVCQATRSRGTRPPAASPRGKHLTITPQKLMQHFQNSFLLALRLAKLNPGILKSIRFREVTQLSRRLTKAYAWCLPAQTPLPTAPS